MERSLNLLIWGISAQLLVVYTIAKWGYIRVNWDRLNPLLKYELLVGDKPRHFFNDIFVKNWQLKGKQSERNEKLRICSKYGYRLCTWYELGKSYVKVVYCVNKKLCLNLSLR